MANESIDPLVTECPSCRTRFRVTESQLEVAAGKVRCGACLEVFRGIEYLVLEGAEAELDGDANEALDALLDELSGEPGDVFGAAPQTTAPDKPLQSLPTGAKNPEAIELGVPEPLPDLEFKDVEKPDVEIQETQAPDVETVNDKFAAPDPVSTPVPGPVPEHDDLESLTLDDLELVGSDEPLDPDTGEDLESDDALPTFEVEVIDASPESESESEAEADADPDTDLVDPEPVGPDPVGPDPVGPDPADRNLDGTDEADDDSPGFAILGDDEDDAADEDSDDTPDIPDVDLDVPLEFRLDDGSDAPDGDDLDGDKAAPKEPPPKKPEPVIDPAHVEEISLDDGASPHPFGWQGAGSGHAAGSDATKSDEALSGAAGQAAAQNSAVGLTGLGPLNVDIEPRDDAPPPSRKWIPAAAVIAGLALIVQVFYSQREEWSKDLALRPIYEFSCQYLGCRLAPQRSVDALFSRNLVVRAHPEVEGALVVDAVIVNGAEFEQPYPEIELRFSSVEGRMVAGRKFQPSEYLGGEAAGATMIAPNTPVHINLSIQDPGAEAVNYVMLFH